MCDWCERAKKSITYTQFIQSMTQEDTARMEVSKSFSERLETLQSAVYSSMAYPAQFIQPMFEARAAYAVPHNYYQNLLVDGARAGVAFAHGSMRSIFFVGNRLVVFSKNVQHKEGKEFFTHFLLLHLEPKEWVIQQKEGELTIHADVTKSMKNLVTGKTEKKHISFHFIHQDVQNRIVSREQVLHSGLLRDVYGKYAGLEKKMASVDIEGYAITVPHFAPHPYMLQLHQEFGFESARSMQEHVLDYFKSHWASS